MKGTADPSGVISSEDFTKLVDPFRRELLAHCYRMLGSAHEAEDLLQETYLSAWRGYRDFEGRSSLRTWFAGRENVGRFLATRVTTPGAMRPVATSANGQPAFGVYLSDEGEHRAHAIVVLTVTAAGIARISMFHNPDLFEQFGLTPTLH